ncbi:MAG: hypothetical protein R3F11_27665 [Verrucomicrobiales bacterium]
MPAQYCQGGGSWYRGKDFDWAVERPPDFDLAIARIVTAAPSTLNI